MLTHSRNAYPRAIVSSGSTPRECESINAGHLAAGGAERRQVKPEVFQERDPFEALSCLVAGTAHPSKFHLSNVFGSDHGVYRSPTIGRSVEKLEVFPPRCGKTRERFSIIYQHQTSDRLAAQ